MLADSAQAADGGQAPFATRQPLRAIGRVYENYLQLVVRADGPITTLFRSRRARDLAGRGRIRGGTGGRSPAGDRKSTRLNSSHVRISYAVFCLKKKKRK